MGQDFRTVTELPGELVSHGQIERLMSRYVWASEYCHEQDVVEVACGAGPGLGLLEKVSKSVEAGDLCAPILALARAHYQDRIPLEEFDAADMPYPDHSKDVVILFEALYYLPDPGAFLSECKRVLKPGGRLLLSTANKDLWDFHRSPFSVDYFGVVELRSLLDRYGFTAQFFGYESVRHLSLVQRILRVIKWTVVKTRLMPKTMAGKRWLKRIVYGRQTPMPNELQATGMTFESPQKLPDTSRDESHRILYCLATLKQ